MNGTVTIFSLFPVRCDEIIILQFSKQVWFIELPFGLIHKCFWFTKMKCLTRFFRSGIGLHWSRCMFSSVIYCRKHCKSGLAWRLVRCMFICIHPWHCVYVAHSQRFLLCWSWKHWRDCQWLCWARMIWSKLVSGLRVSPALYTCTLAASVSLVYRIGWKEWKFKVVLLGLMCFILSAHDACVCSLYNADMAWYFTMFVCQCVLMVFSVISINIQFH